MAGKVLLANGTVIDVRGYSFLGFGLEVWVHRDEFSTFWWQEALSDRRVPLKRTAPCDLVLGPGGWLAAWEVE